MFPAGAAVKASTHPAGKNSSLIYNTKCSESKRISYEYESHLLVDRVYATELVAYFEQHGWTCDDCKACIVCDQSPSESEKSEDLLVNLNNT